MRLTNFDVAEFLRDTWQQRPLLIRNPWDSWANPLDPDELAGLACEDHVESRLLSLAGSERRIEHGRFPPERFGALEPRGWTLLVQAVDHHVPAVAQLQEAFRFIPNWRHDDVMVSYATDGGGVGPHFDQYDVFLVQGLGRRRWRVGPRCDTAGDNAAAMQPHEDLRLLADVEWTDEWVLEPGDILYVPPRFAHDGVALGDDCMTYSVGFRAPSRSELVAHFCDHLLAGMAEDDRHVDGLLDPSRNPGEIPPDALEQLHAMVSGALTDRTGFARWFGGFTSTPKYPEADWRPETPIGADEARQWIAARVPLARNPASRFVFVREDGGAVLLFVDGECFECSGASAGFAEALCAGPVVELDEAADDGLVELVCALINQGSVTFESDEDEEED